MPQTQDRRGFLKTSLAVGALAFAGGRSSATTPTPTPPADADNPRVRPGRVNWHEGFDAACAASDQSGKPVLLFHMMGRMDQRFC